MGPNRRGRLPLEMSWDPTKRNMVWGVEDRTIRYKHNGYTYELLIGSARVTQPSDASIVIQLHDNDAELRFDQGA